MAAANESISETNYLIVDIAGKQFIFRIFVKTRNSVIVPAE